MKTLLCLGGFLLVLQLKAKHAGYQLTEIHSTQSFYLNNSTRGTLGTGDHRSYLPINLPSKTVEWYYSFTANQVSAETHMELYGQLIQLLEPSGISSALFEAVTVPEGNARCNIYLMDQANAMAFDGLQPFNYWPSATRNNYSQGVVKVSDVIQSGIYLCFENPASWEGVTINVEVVALVDTSTTPPPKSDTEKLVESLSQVAEAIEQNKKQKQAQRQKVDEVSNYWNTGWVLYEAGDFSNSIKYTKKALAASSHPGLYFNLGLAQWCQGEKDSSLTAYLQGLNHIYALEEKEQAVQVLQSGVEDIINGRDKHNFFTETPPALQLLSLKLKEVQAVEKWKKRF